MHLGKLTILVEITDLHADSSEILVVGTGWDGQTSVIDAQLTPWPIPAREWRPMMDAVRRWIVEAALD